MKNINFKNLTIGLLLGASLILIIGAIDNTAGKYQCCPAGDNDLAVFVIDTRTGQTWRLARTNTIDFGTPLERKSEKQSQTPFIK